MFRFFTGSTTSTSASNPSSSNTKKDTVPMHDLDTNHKYEVESIFSQPKQKNPNIPAPKNVEANYETYRDYERGVTMPW